MQRELVPEMSNLQPKVKRAFLSGSRDTLLNPEAMAFAHACAMTMSGIAPGTNVKDVEAFRLLVAKAKNSKDKGIGIT